MKKALLLLLPLVISQTVHSGPLPPYIDSGCEGLLYSKMPPTFGPGPTAEIDEAAKLLAAQEMIWLDPAMVKMASPASSLDTSEASLRKLNQLFDLWTNQIDETEFRALEKSLPVASVLKIAGVDTFFSARTLIHRFPAVMDPGEITTIFNFAVPLTIKEFAILESFKNQLPIEVFADSKLMFLNTRDLLDPHIYSSTRQIKTVILKTRDREFVQSLSTHLAYILNLTFAMRSDANARGSKRPVDPAFDGIFGPLRNFQQRVQAMNEYPDANEFSWRKKGFFPLNADAAKSLSWKFFDESNHRASRTWAQPQVEEVLQVDVGSGIDGLL